MGANLVTPSKTNVTNESIEGLVETIISKPPLPPPSPLKPVKVENRTRECVVYEQDGKRVRLNGRYTSDQHARAVKYFEKA
jgi:hypothetical protein